MLKPKLECKSVRLYGSVLEARNNNCAVKLLHLKDTYLQNFEIDRVCGCPASRMFECACKNCSKLCVGVFRLILRTSQVYLAIILL